MEDTCFLSDTNVGYTGALRKYYPMDYYELKAGTLDCSGKRIFYKQIYLMNEGLVLNI